MDLSVLAQAAGSTGVLIAVWQTITYLIKRYAERGRDRADVEKTTTETAQVATDTRLARSTDDRAWVEQFRADAVAARLDAAQARTDAEACRRQSWTAQDEAAASRRERDGAVEQLNELRTEVAGCARAGCPLRGE